MTFGDHASGAWMAEVYEKCLRETSVGQSQVDLNLLAHMCKKEPKNAQVAMQLLAHELRTNLSGKPVSEASEFGQTCRLLIGSIYIAYSMSYGSMDGRVPDELQAIVRLYPEILRCFEFVLSANRKSIEQIADAISRPARPWWKIW